MPRRDQTAKVDASVAVRRFQRRGACLHSGKVWVADPLDGTISYATGSPLCGVMLGLLEEGVPTLGVIDLPFLGVRVRLGCAGRRWAR